MINVEEEHYTVVIKGKPEGPFSLAELKALNLKPDTFVRKPGMDDYKEAHEIAELRALVGFRHQQTAPQYFAAFDQRLVADVIDHLIVLAGYLIFMLMVYVVTELHTFRIIAGVSFLGAGFVRLIYGGIAEASPKQATIGKRVMDLKVTDLMGNRLTMANSIGRNFARIVSNITLGVGYLYCFLNKKQQCLHDVMADAVVIKQRLM